MSSTFAGLNTVFLGMAAQQVALNTVGQNVANASTDGYSRQSADLVTTNSQTGYGQNSTYQVGTGVTVASITRARNSFLDQQYWAENSTLSYNNSVQSSLSTVENSFGDPSDTGVQSVLDQFYQGWQTLSTNASDEATRTDVREDGVAVVNSIQTSATQLKNLASTINSNVDSDVNTINQTVSQIDSLNKQILSVESSGTDQANDLRDKRDLLVDNLSSIADTQVNQDASGNYIVRVGDATLVDGKGCQQLAVKKTTDPDYGYEVDNVVVAGGAQQAVTFSNGEMKGLLDSRDSTQSGVKGYLNNLSSMSQFFLQDFNAVSRSGYGTDNSTGNNFFGNSSTNYATSGVSGTYPKEDWIDALAVNPALFAADGTAKIAAKSAGDTISSTQSNASGGSAAIFATGTYSEGSTPTSVKVTLNTDTATPPNITGINYSTSIDGGKTWSTPQAATPVTGASGSYTLSISGLSVAMNISANAANATGDSYSYSLDQNSVASSITVTDSNASGGAGTVTSASGTYTNGDTATSVLVKPYDTTSASVASTGQINQIKYSTDGGTTWSSSATTLNSDGTFSLTLSGITLKLQLATSNKNTVNDQYSFTLSKGNVASGDNAVLLSNRLKTDTTATLGNKSLDGYYSSVIGTLGTQSQNAQNMSTNQQSMVTQISNQRQSISGVNMDEEMTNMIMYNKGYSAAAQVLTTINAMLTTLMASIVA